MPFAREAEATLCNQTRLQNKVNVRVKLFETSSSKSRCLRSCCSLAYVMACDSLRTVARGESRKAEDQPSCRKSAFNEQNAKANVRSRPQPLLSSCIEEPTGHPNPESKRQHVPCEPCLGRPRRHFDSGPGWPVGPVKQADAI